MTLASTVTPTMQTGISALFAALILVALPSLAAESSAPTAGDELIPVDADMLNRIVNDHPGPVLVNLWATWCQPCKEEMPDLIRLRHDYHAQGFELILVSADFTRASAAALEYLRGMGVTWPAYLKDQGDQAFINGVDTAWSGALPHSLLYDASGELVHRWAGKLTYEDAAARLDRLLSITNDHE